VPFEEAYGGFGGDMSDVAVMMEEFGKAMVLEPFVETLILFGRLLQRLGSDEQKNDLLPKLIAGEIKGKLAYIEKQSRYAFTDVQTQAEKTDNGYRLSGSKMAIPFAAEADYFIVLARLSGEQTDRNGLALFLVDAKNTAIDASSYLMMDGQRYGNITFDQLDLPKEALLAEGEVAVAAFEETLNEAVIAIAAEGVGAMEKLRTETVEYTKVRKQFDTPISTFQAIQHRMVDMFMASEQTRSLLYRALCSWQALASQAESDPSEHLKNVHALKYMLGKAGKFVAGEAVQLHGGMGMTEEMAVGHYLKRMRLLGALYGDADFHLTSYNAMNYS